MLMHRQPRRARRGFTLIEMLVSMFILSVIGVAFTKFMTMQNRFFDREMNAKAARSIARGSMTLLLADLRMVQDSGGVDSASSDGKALRVIVPYRYGLFCGNAGVKSTVSMLPSDSAGVSMSTLAGYAWRDTTTGLFSLSAITTAPVVSLTPILCTTTALIRTVTINGRAGDIMDIPQLASGAAVGTSVFFWQKITYSFATSSLFPGMKSLWRNVQGGRNEELLGPFDTTARFRYYERGDDTSRTVVPALALIKGVDLVLSASSPHKSAGRTNEKVQMVTSVFFKNVRKY
jgi:prepilin-type N-terminal cleavage/methylation domain-containing protein